MNRRWRMGRRWAIVCILMVVENVYCSNPLLFQVTDAAVLFIWENVLEQLGLLRWWRTYSCWFIRRRPAGPLGRSGDMFSWRRPAAGVSQSIGCSTGAPWITPGTVAGPNGNQWGFRELWFWMRWKVDSTTGAFRPIKGWLPEKMVQLMHSADVPDVLGEFQSRQAGYSLTLIFN